MLAPYPKHMNSYTRLIPVLALTLGAATFAPARAAVLWAGADVRTSGLDVHAGSALLPVPFIGTVGIEAGAASNFSGGLAEIRAGGTLRDLNLPFTATDGYASGGLSYHFENKINNTSNNGIGVYVEGGLRGPLLGPVGWRAGVKADTKSGLSLGAGLEFRF